MQSACRIVSWLACNVIIEFQIAIALNFSLRNFLRVLVCHVRNCQLPEFSTLIFSVFILYILTDWGGGGGRAKDIKTDAFSISAKDPFEHWAWMRDGSVCPW